MDDEISDKESTIERHFSNTHSSKWMPSKMRFMRRMMNSTEIAPSNPRTMPPKLQDLQQPIADGNTSSSNSYNQHYHHHHSVPNCTVRVCSDCNTTKTPLWRSGPRGPKSLCNACGIRRIRKVRRAMAAAALNGGFTPAVAPAKARKEKRSDSEPCTRGRLQLEEFTMSLSNNKAFHQVFPQDEKEAAVLLMALSCNRIRS